MDPTQSIDVFVSYSAPDRERVRPLVESLQQAGMSIWWDTRIAPGAGFDAEIQRALDAAKCVLVVWSKQSITSEWVISEASEGLEKDILVPISIDDVKPPLAFRRRQTIALSDRIDAPQQVVAAIRGVLAGENVEVQRSAVRSHSNSQSVVSKAALFLLSALCIAALTASLWLYSRTQSGIDLIARIPFNLSDLAFDTTYAMPTMALSPDGRLVVYVDKALNMLRLQHIDSLEGKLLIGTDNANNPFFSPDGEWVGFFANGAVHRISIDKGFPRFIAKTEPYAPFGGTWTEQDVIVWGTTRSGLKSVSVEGGTAQTVTTLDTNAGDQAHRRPTAVKGSNIVLFERTPNELWAQGLTSKERKFLLKGSSPSYVDSGHILFAEGGTIWAVPFDSTRTEVTGEATAVQQGVAQGGVAYAAAGKNMLIYHQDPGEVPGVLVLLTQDNVIREIDKGHFSTPVFSDDGSAIAVSVISASSSDVMTYDLESGSSSLIANDAFLPVWAPDKSSITFTRPGVGIVRKTFTGKTPAEELLVEHKLGIFSNQWINNGKTLIYNAVNAETASDLFALHEDGTQILDQDETEKWSISLSKDEDWVAYIFDDNIYISRYPDFSIRWHVDAGVHPRWRGNDALYYMKGNDIWSVDIRFAPSPVIGTPHHLADAGVSSRFEPRFNVDEKGRLIYVKYQEAERPPPVLMVNWESRLP